MLQKLNTNKKKILSFFSVRLVDTESASGNLHSAVCSRRAAETLSAEFPVFSRGFELSQLFCCLREKQARVFQVERKKETSVTAHALASGSLSSQMFSARRDSSFQTDVFSGRAD